MPLATVVDSTDGDVLWLGRLARLREHAVVARRRAGARRVDLDDAVQEGALAWLETGVVAGEFLPPAALAAVRSALATGGAEGRAVRLSRTIASPQVAHAFDNDELELLRTHAARLRFRQRFVFDVRLDPEGPRLTYAEIGALLDLSVERVRQLTFAAFRRIASSIRQAQIDARLERLGVQELFPPENLA